MVVFHLSPFTFHPGKNFNKLILSFLYSLLPVCQLSVSRQIHFYRPLFSPPMFANVSFIFYFLSPSFLSSNVCQCAANLHPSLGETDFFRAVGLFWAYRGRHLYWQTYLICWFVECAVFETTMCKKGWICSTQFGRCMPKMKYLACTLRSSRAISQSFRDPQNMALAFLPPPPGRTFILDSDCDQKSFLSIQQQLRLPSAEILLSAIDIPLQKRNSDNGKSDPFRIENFRGE